MKQIKDTIIKITTQTYFGTYFYNSGWVLLAASVPMGVITWYVGVLLFTAGAILVATVYKLEIDLHRNKIDDYLLFLGWKTNLISKTFSALHFVLVKEGRYSQQLNYKSLSTVVEGVMYSAYLHTDIENFYLGESKSKRIITKKAKSIAIKLQIELHSESNAD